MAEFKNNFSALFFIFTFTLFRCKKIGSGENYQTQEISVLHRKLMEIKGSPSNEPVDGRIIRTDFADWEKLGAELPQMFTTPPVPPCTPSGIEEEVRKNTLNQNLYPIALRFSLKPQKSAECNSHHARRNETQH